MIKDIIISQLKTIPDERGEIMHMLKASDPNFSKFGEIYFATAYPGVIKGWHLHKTQEQNYCVIKGMIKLVIYDPRKNSSTFNKIQEIFLGEKSSIGANSWVMSSENMEIRIGDRCALAPNVTILTQNFFSNQNLKMERLHDYKNIIIGNDTWIGANTFIKQGVRIGNNCVVEANSVVKEDLEDFTIYNNFEIRKIKL